MTRKVSMQVIVCLGGGGGGVKNEGKRRGVRVIEVGQYSILYHAHSLALSLDDSSPAWAFRCVVGCFVPFYEIQLSTFI